MIFEELPVKAPIINLKRLFIDPVPTETPMNISIDRSLHHHILQGRRIDLSYGPEFLALTGWEKIPEGIPPTDIKLPHIFDTMEEYHAVDLESDMVKREADRKLLSRRVGLRKRTA